MPKLTPDEERELRNWALTWAEAGHVQGRLILATLDHNRELTSALQAALETIEEFNIREGEVPANHQHADDQGRIMR